jgi:hypothetical protein
MGAAHAPDSSAHRAETFFEPHAQLRLPRSSLAADRKARGRQATLCCLHSKSSLSPAQELPASASWHSLSGVLATLHSKASLLLAEEAMAEAPERDGMLGSGLQAMNRVATVVGTALDSFVEVRCELVGISR